MTLVVWGAFAVMAPAAVLALLAFRKLVEIEFSQCQAEWLKDGKPVGESGSRKAATFWGSGFATQAVSNSWLSETPEWVRKSPEAMATLRRFRLWVTIMALGMVAEICVGLFAT
jgi:hypothetical protein